MSDWKDDLRALPAALQQVVYSYISTAELRVEVEKAHADRLRGVILNIANVDKRHVSVASVVAIAEREVLSWE